MYTILICDDNSMMTTKRERIMQRSKLVDNLQFLVPQFYNERDMSTYTVQLEYVLPCSRKYCTEILELSNEMYKDHLKYLLPFDTKLTSESGSIEVQLTFVKTELDSYGKGVQRVRKISPTTIDIIPISAWSDIIPDSALSAIDERLIKLDAQIRAMDEMNQIIIDNKADNIQYNETENSIQLLSGDKEIGNRVTLKIGDAALEDGVPVVDFNDISSGDIPTEDEDDNVVEF